MTDLSKNIQALREKKAVVEMGGGEAAIEKQIAMGKLTARDRILSLLDKNSFHEYDLFVTNPQSITIWMRCIPRHRRRHRRLAWSHIICTGRRISVVIWKMSDMRSQAVNAYIIF